MKITTAQRKRAKIRLSIQGPSGSGKTFSSLLIAKGLVGDWSKICVIDTKRSVMFVPTANAEIKN